MGFIWSVNGEVESRRAHAHLRGSETPRSRASSINFLNRIAAEGFLVYREGHHEGGLEAIIQIQPSSSRRGGLWRRGSWTRHEKN